MGQRLKFNLAILLPSLIAMFAAGYLVWEDARKDAISAIEREINLMRSNALAIRSYTAREILPLLEADRDIMFLPQTVPSFSAQTVFETFQKSFPDYSYKEAALNPTNPDDLANPLEEEMILHLRENPDLEHMSQVVEQDGKNFYAMAFPLTIKNEACLECHTTPDLAPATMVDLYGPDNGFGWKLGETIGAQIFLAPLDNIKDDIQIKMTKLMAALGAGVLLVLIFANIALGKARSSR